MRSKSLQPGLRFFGVVVPFENSHTGQKLFLQNEMKLSVESRKKWCKARTKL